MFYLILQCKYHARMIVILNNERRVVVSEKVKDYEQKPHGGSS